MKKLFILLAVVGCQPNQYPYKCSVEGIGKVESVLPLDCDIVRSDVDLVALSFRVYHLNTSVLKKLNIKIVAQQEKWFNAYYNKNIAGSYDIIDSTIYVARDLSALDHEALHALEYDEGRGFDYQHKTWNSNHYYDSANFYENNHLELSSQ